MFGGPVTSYCWNVAAAVPPQNTNTNQRHPMIPRFLTRLAIATFPAGVRSAAAPMAAHAASVALQAESRNVSTPAFDNLPPGFGVGAPPFSTANPSNWREQDYIPLQIHLTGGPATAQQIDIQIDHNDVSGNQGIAGLVNYTPSRSPALPPSDPAGHIFT